MQLEAMLAAAQDEIEERDKAIIELYEKYQDALKDPNSEKESVAQSISENHPPVDRIKNKKKSLRRKKQEIKAEEDVGKEGSSHQG